MARFVSVIGCSFPGRSCPLNNNSESLYEKSAAFLFFFNSSPCHIRIQILWEETQEYMPQVNTVKGTVDVSCLGCTLMHEHIFVLSPEYQQNYPEHWGDEAVRVQDAVAQLRKLKAQGIDSLVDMTVLGSGRYLPRIQQIADQVEINILAAAGLYTLNELPQYLQGRERGSKFRGSKMLLDMLVNDIQEGIAGTGVKAAILKCATDRQGITPGVEIVLRTVAHAQLATGVPIYAHTYAKSRSGLDQLHLFQEEGVDLSRVIIGHCGDTMDFGYLEMLLEKGSYIGMDRFGIDTILPLKSRVAVVAHLCRKGYAGQMVLSQDAACYMDWFQDESLVASVPNWNYFHILNHVVPALRERGVTENQIYAMLVKNPCQIFSGNLG
jgi:phosphotriesterase-related protein